MTTLTKCLNTAFQARNATDLTKISLTEGLGEFVAQVKNEKDFQKYEDFCLTSQKEHGHKCLCHS